MLGQEYLFTQIVMSTEISSTPNALSGLQTQRTQSYQRADRTFRLLLQATDLVVINIAFIVAYFLRYTAGFGGDVADENYVDLGTYLPLQAGLSLTLLAVYNIAGLYRKTTRRPLLDEAGAIVLSTSFGMMVFLAAIFLVRGFAYSRGLFLIAWVLLLAFLISVRVSARLIRAFLRSRGIGVRRVLVVGEEPLAHTVMHILATEPGLDYVLVGFVKPSDPRDIGRFKCLGSLSDIPDLLQAHRVDEVLVAFPSAFHQLVPEITDLCAREGLAFKIVPDLYEMSLSLSQVDIEDLRGIPVIGLRDTTIQGSNRMLKRAVDIMTASVISLTLAPLWFAIALAIKLDSQGPVYFAQVRLGKDGRPFRALKFRSMYTDAEAQLAKLMEHNEASGPIFKMRNDPRITRVGRFLRRTSLDELPQLWNVLKGEMSLVGPRPPIPAEVEKYQEWHKKRLKVQPGMTGMWQVRGRSELPFDEMVLLDLYYIENWSLGLDFQILLRTLPAVLSGRGAY